MQQIYESIAEKEKNRGEAIAQSKSRPRNAEVEHEER